LLTGHILVFIGQIFKVKTFSKVLRDQVLILCLIYIDIPTKDKTVKSIKKKENDSNDGKNNVKRTADEETKSPKKKS